MQKRPLSILVFCNPLMDYITHVEPRFLEELGARPGTMNLIEEGQLEKLLDKISDYHVLPGGSGANTVRGFSWLNRDSVFPAPVFFGAVGRDAIGNKYIQKLIETNVESRIVQKKEQTGVSVVAVTPDFERTMFTFLGACRAIEEADIDFSLVASASILHVTGYMWDTENQKRIVKRAVDCAHRADTLVSFDLSDPFVVNRYREEFITWIPQNVDLLFGNRDEFSLLGKETAEDKEIMEKVKGFARLVVMKAGPAGAYVSEGGEIYLAPGKKARVHDTTGAGDAFAAGFLFSLLLGKSPQECASAGNTLAGSIVEVEGCDYAKLSYSAFAG